MSQTPEAQSFISRVVALPDGPVLLDDALQPSLDDEAALRVLWATDKSNPRLANPYVGLVDVFHAPPALRTTRARVPTPEDLNTKHIFPLSDDKRRSEGTPCIVDSLEDFARNWSIFTEGSLSGLTDWSNVVAAGGSVQACLAPLPEEVVKSGSKRAIRKWYHNTKFPASDVDLFLWGLNAEEAEKKIVKIYEAVRDSVPWDVTCIRTKHTISIHSQYPYRCVQIVLRLYSSPAELLAGFDVDAPCCAFDGTRVYASPRALIAQMRQSNTVDVTRRSPSYEARLAKYASRGFEVYVPGMERGEIDPTIFERAISKMHGLSRLLVLEHLSTTNTRYAFLESRRNLRGRPHPLGRYQRNKKKYKGDLKGDEEGMEMNDYDVALLHIPYGPGWDARRIERLVYSTDLGMNSTFNPKNKGRRLHRHPAFFGTVQECMEDCCEHCPEPIDDDEKALAKEEGEQYISGRVSFVEEDPGRQRISGSFNPIDEGEWSDQVYVKPTQVFFAAIARRDVQAVKTILDEAEAAAAAEAVQSPPEEQGKKQTILDFRDHVGRSPLHVAILCNAEEIAIELVKRGGRMSARLVDGRNCLHLAAQRGLVGVVEALLERSKVNAEEVKKDEEEGEGDKEKKGEKGEGERERASSEDDWSSAEDADEEEEEEDDDEDGSDSGASGSAPPETDLGKGDNTGEVPEDTDEPDVLDINLPCWDFGFTPLAYAVMYADLAMVEVLVSNGADVKNPSEGNNTDPVHPLTLTLLRAQDDSDVACAIAQKLLHAGASSSTADNELKTIFHLAVFHDRVDLVKTFLKYDSGAKEAVNCPMVVNGSAIFPLVTAIAKRNYAMVALLLANGAKAAFEEEDLTGALDALAPSERNKLFSYGVSNYLDEAYGVVESAITKHDDIVQLLLALSAPVNDGLKTSRGRSLAYQREKRTLLDWVRFAIGKLTPAEEEPVVVDAVVVDVEMAEETAGAESGWRGYLAGLRKKVKEADEWRNKNYWKKEEDEVAKWRKEEDERQKVELKAYLVEVERLLLARGAKTWDELHPLNKNENKEQDRQREKKGEEEKDEEDHYSLLSNVWYHHNFVPEHQRKAYHELFEACYKGDNEKVQQLCLPAQPEAKTPALNISVQVKRKWENSYEQNGWTPLFAALAGRRWSTAKLIVAIASAQYKSDDEEETGKWKNFKMDIDSDSDSDCESDDSEATIEKPQFKFVDIASRTSEVKTDVHPRKMLQDLSAKFAEPEEDHFVTRTANLLLKAVYEKDLQSFVHILGLYESLPTSLDIDPHKQVIGAIMNSDNVDIFDEYIRRTGHGFDFKTQQKEGEADDQPIVLNDKNKVYLGLNVHGKKRADLARKNDPNAVNDNDTFVKPLLWEAISRDRKALVEYLSSERPLAAYKFYISSHRGEERAERLHRIPDLAKVLPEVLGWKISSIGESPLTAAILNDKVDMIKLLFSKDAKLMKQALREQIKFIGYNPILLAVATNKSIEVIDFLRSRAVPLGEKDLVKGWNVYHFVCSQSNGQVLEHLLSKLPKDLTAELLQQQSKHTLNTPLLIAVKVGSIRCVKALLPFAKGTLKTRDANGSLPLHVAVQRGYAEIVKLLLAAGFPETLYMENAVGSTVLDIISLLALQDSIQNWKSTNFRDTVGQLDDADVHPYRYQLYDLEAGLPVLRQTIEGLESEGELKKQKKLAWELNHFTTMMETRFRDAKKAAEAHPCPEAKVNEDRQDVSNVKTTLEVIVEAVNANPNDRQLVHLFDVQMSVQAALERQKDSNENDDGEYYDEEELQDEEDVEKTERKHSMIFGQLYNALRRDQLYD